MGWGDVHVTYVRVLWGGAMCTWPLRTLYMVAAWQVFRAPNFILERAQRLCLCHCSSALSLLQGAGYVLP